MRPPGAIPALAEVNDPEEEANSEGPTVLVRRGSRQSTRNTKRRNRRSKDKKPKDTPAQPDAPKPAIVKSAAPRLSRRVMPGTTESGAAPTLEDRLEMLIPITEGLEDGPQIARQIIWALKTHGPATARQLARRTRMKKVAILQLLQGLLTVGLVIQEGQGERARFLAPTE